MSIEFVAWPKTARLFRDVVITEKIDGTNAAVGIRDGIVYAQSRTRIISLEADNFGFARWVSDNAQALVATLGEGLHFGEWWGSGIQRGYGLTKGEKRFSLFNVARHRDADLSAVPGLGVVPVLFEGPYNTHHVRVALAELEKFGSWAAPGFKNPEGVCIFHTASRQVYKVTLENDGAPKALADAA